MIEGGEKEMLQTTMETETSTATKTTLPPKVSSTEIVFKIIREELAGNGGEMGAALEVALDHVQSHRLAKDIFGEHGAAILGHLWNNYAGSSEQEYPEPPTQIKGVRPKIKRYTPGGVFDKWVAIGSTGKSKLLGDLTLADLDIIIKSYKTHIDGSIKNKAKYEDIRERLQKSKKKHVRDGLSVQEIVALELPARQLK